MVCPLPILSYFIFQKVEFFMVQPNTLCYIPKYWKQVARKCLLFDSIYGSHEEYQISKNISDKCCIRLPHRKYVKFLINSKGWLNKCEFILWSQIHWKSVFSILCIKFPCMKSYYFSERIYSPHCVIFNALCKGTSIRYISKSASWYVNK